MHACANHGLEYARLLVGGTIQDARDFIESCRAACNELFAHQHSALKLASAPCAATRLTRRTCCDTVAPLTPTSAYALLRRYSGGHIGHYCKKVMGVTT